MYLLNLSNPYRKIENKMRKLEHDDLVPESVTKQIVMLGFWFALHAFQTGISLKNLRHPIIGLCDKK